LFLVYILAFYLAYILAFYVTFFLAYILAFYVACYVAYILAVYLAHFGSLSGLYKIQNFRSHEKQKPKHKILDANRTPKSLLQVNNAGHKSDVVMLATLSKND
jgi:hypothetical protein